MNDPAYERQEITGEKIDLLVKFLQHFTEGPREAAALLLSTYVELRRNHSKDHLNEMDEMVEEFKISVASHKTLEEATN